MGSTGSGNFSDYPGSRSNPDGAGGGASGEDRCARAFSAALEEVEQCEYFEAHGDVPAPNTPVQLEHRKRLFAVDSTGQTVGALPTKLNYLADCMADGFSYEGRVVSSSSGAAANVQVDFAPDQS